MPDRGDLQELDLRPQLEPLCPPTSSNTASELEVSYTPGSESYYPKTCLQKFMIHVFNQKLFRILALVPENPEKKMFHLKK